MSNIEPTPFGDKYVLVEHIATGGMAEIYRANYSGIEGFAKELVVKRLREEFAERDDVVGMFLDEARVAATLTHNNVVHTYDLGELGGEYFIAMELLKGEELVMVLRRSGQLGVHLPLEISLGIIMQGLEGLEYVHSRQSTDGEALGLVHRDINPTNIHVGYDGVAKIVDFGIAATRAKALADAGPGRFAGKLSYMAPEQVLGQDIDGRADLFAMGVLLWEMCLRKRLFRGPADEVRQRILEGDVPAPTFVDPDFPPALEAVIMRSLEPDPDDRYQSADHMFRDLDTFMQEAGLSWTPRRISAYMSELFGQGAPAHVDYEDEYDDLEDDGLDFDQFDRLAQEEEEAPDWARSLEAGSSGTKKRSMTLGNLESLVADVAEGDGGGKRSSDAKRGSGKHRKVEGKGDGAASSKSGKAKTGKTKTKTRSTKSVKTVSGKSRATMRTASVSTVGQTGSFGQGVMAQQSRSRTGSLFVWLAVLVVLGGLGYVIYTVMTQK